MISKFRDKESKNSRFKRIAEKRVNFILDHYRKLANLANTRNYDYSTDEVKKIFSKLKSELNNIQKVFMLKKKKKDTFRF